MGKSPPVGEAYWAASEDCIVCKQGDFCEGYGPRTLVTCDCCLDKGVHIECWHKHSDEQLTEERLDSPAFQWFCSEGCKRVSEQFVELTGVQRPLPESEYSVEVVRWSEKDRGMQKAVGQAKSIFNSAFSPLIMDNGRNLIDMVCEAYESPDGGEPAAAAGQQGQKQQKQEQGGQEKAGGGKGGSKGRQRMQVDGGSEEEESGVEEDEDVDRESHNFSTFRVLLLRKRGQVVSAATVRAFGTKFCEVPFVATKEDYRREGHCRRLMQALEEMLHGMGVEWVVLPAMASVLPMWTRKFGYTQFREAECAVIEERIVMPDPSSATLVRKQVQGPQAVAAAAAAAKARAGRAAADGGGKGKAAADTGGRRVRFGLSYTEASDDSSDSDDDFEGPGSSRRGAGGRGGGKKGGSRGRREAKLQQESDGSEYELSQEEEEEEDDDVEGLVDENEEEAEGEEGGEGEGEGEAGGPCERCGCRRSEAWMTSPLTGDCLCAQCVTDKDLEGIPSGSGTPANGTAGGSSRRHQTGLQCPNCGGEGGRKERKGGGVLECTACSRYRKTHGEPRPEHLYRRAQARRQGSKQASKPTTPAPALAAGPAGTTATPAPRTSAPAQRQRQANSTSAGQQLQAAHVNMRRLVAEQRRLRAAGGSWTHEAARRSELQRLQVEQLVGEMLGEHLLRLVHGSDEQQALVLQAYDQRAQQQLEECKQLQAQVAVQAGLEEALQQHKQQLERAWQEQAAQQRAWEAERAQQAAERAQQAAERAQQEARAQQMEAELKLLRRQLAEQAQQAWEAGRASVQPGAGWQEGGVSRGMPGGQALTAGAELADGGNDMAVTADPADEPVGMDLTAEHTDDSGLDFKAAAGAAAAAESEAAAEAAEAAKAVVPQVAGEEGEPASRVLAAAQPGGSIAGTSAPTAAPTVLPARPTVPPALQPAAPLALPAVSPAVPLAAAGSKQLPASNLFAGSSPAAGSVAAAAPAMAAGIAAAAAAGAGAGARAGACACAGAGTTADAGAPVPAGAAFFLSPGPSGDAGASRRRLTTGRASGGSARRKPFRSRPVPQGAGADAAASAGAAASVDAAASIDAAAGAGATGPGADLSLDSSQQERQHGQQEQHGVQMQQERQGGGSSTGSEDWGRRLFGVFAGAAGSTVSPGDSSQPVGWTGAGGTSGGVFRAVAGDPENHPAANNIPPSPGSSLHTVADGAELAALPGGRGSAAGGVGAAAANRRPAQLAATLQLALGSQESGSNSLPTALPPPESAGTTAIDPAPVRQLAVLQISPPPAAAAAALQAGADATGKQPVPVTVTVPVAVLPAGSSLRGVAYGDQEEALRAVDDLAQCLAG